MVKRSGPQLRGCWGLTVLRQARSGQAVVYSRERTRVYYPELLFKACWER